MMVSRIVIRRLAVVMLVATLVLGSAGCFYPSFDDGEEVEPYLTEGQMVAKGMTYLKERYGIEFHVERVMVGGAFGTTPIGLFVTTPLYPDMFPQGVNWERVDGVDTFYDDFIYTVMEPGYQIIAQDLVTPQFPVNFTYVNLDGPYNSPAEFGKDTTFEQFHAWARDNAIVTTVISIPTTEAADYETKADLLKAQLQQIVPTGALRVVVLTQENYELDKETYPRRTELGVKWPSPEESRVEFEWEA